MDLIFVTLFVLNEVKFIEFKEEQNADIQLISLVLFLLNEDRSMEYREEHS